MFTTYAPGFPIQAEDDPWVASEPSCNRPGRWCRQPDPRAQWACTREKGHGGPCVSRGAMTARVCARWAGSLFLPIAGDDPAQRPPPVVPAKCGRCKEPNVYENPPNQPDGTWRCWTCNRRT